MNVLATFSLRSGQPGATTASEPVSSVGAASPMAGTDTFTGTGPGVCSTGRPVRAWNPSRVG